MSLAQMTLPISIAVWIVFGILYAPKAVDHPEDLGSCSGVFCVDSVIAWLDVFFTVLTMGMASPELGINPLISIFLFLLASFPWILVAIGIARGTPV